MSTGDLHLILFALVATLSPVGVAATLAVIRSGRVKALAFAIGLVASQTLACAALVAVGGATVPHRDSGHPTFRALLELGFGLWLLWLALLVHRRPQRPASEPSARTQAALARLERLRVPTTFAAGVLLGIGGPKRLVLTALASASIATASVESTTEAALVCGYALAATVLVWVPVLAYEIVGDRVTARIDAAQLWLARHQRRTTLSVLVAVGLLALVDAVAALL